jgi:predicted GNAT family N-acyltransferase
VTLRVSLVEFEQFASEIRQIRQAVFQVEQQVAEAVDFDGLDASASHLLLWIADQPVGTARIRLLSPTVAKIERVALLAPYRGQGLGQQLMQQVLHALDDWHISEAQLHAQAQTVNFYRKLGFVPQGEPFYEADILHVTMCKYRVQM